MARAQNDGIEGSRGHSGRHSCRFEAIRGDSWRRGSYYPRISQLPPRPFVGPLRDVATQTQAPGALGGVPTCAAPPARPGGAPGGTSRASTGEEGAARGPQTVGEDRPLPDLLLGRSQGPADRGASEDELSGRVAEQLRIIGDEMNAIYLRRRVGARPG
nr:PREDICTED: translation initiation factor IF-2-like [Lepisosteus oculatus]